MISGATGVGKTRFGFGLVRAMCTGESFLGYEPAHSSPARVLYLDYEVGRREMADRLKTFSHLNFSIICFDDPQLGDSGLLPLDSEDGHKQVTGFLKSVTPDVLIIDNLYSAVTGSIMGGSETSGAHDKIVPLLRALSRDGVATILFHHSGHDKTRQYGDSRMTWQMSSCLHLSAPEKLIEGETRIVIEEKKVRSSLRRVSFEAIIDTEGKWSLVEKPIVLKPLAERPAWLAARFSAMARAKGLFLDVDGKSRRCVFQADLRAEYKETFFSHDPTGSGERKAWGRDIAVLVTYFTPYREYFASVE